MPADDFEDDYVSDDSVAIYSEDEGQVLDGLDQPEKAAPTVDSIAEAEAKASKKRKRREKEKAKRAEKKRKLEDAGETQQTKSATSLSPEHAAEYLSTYQAKTYPKSSTLEMEDLRISADFIADTTQYDGLRTAEELGHIITQTFPRLLIRLGQTPKHNGAPTLIFIAAAALRVIDITRVLKKHRGTKGGEVAKLFAKHIKLQDHVAYLKRTKIGVAVGTPGRISQLLESESLTLPALTHIFIDSTFRDSKKRSMLDIPETRDELFRGVLGRQNIRDGLRAGKFQLVLF
ncbi:hypothetical protein M422DRAFT_228826 [Sphaerobolus stellatus SS14]|uniref:Protein CMS1 n=1 Tax=Sphaerobolus stellatus (strain SS14) TaxID=990650 RepID=A0A0C9UM59_SPHS4|nr:hypothetical protein M422DRAFT_228826 [Sphaerobolus stellatus SS14]